MNNLIAVLSKGLKKNKDGKWRNTNIDEADEQWGAPGGYLRVLAASYLYKDSPDQFIVASGGKGWEISDDNRPLLCKVIKEELVNLGVPEKNIIEERVSDKTFGQLWELQKIIINKEINKLIIISNIYHLPRIQAMIENISKLSRLKKLLSKDKLKIEAAEDILMVNDSKEWQNKIKNAYKSERMKKIIKIERQGVKQIREGTYKYR